MRPSTRSTLVSLVALALAGCAAPEGGGDLGPAPPEQVFAAEWQVGDWWTYEVVVGGASRTETRLVTAEEGPDWIVDTTDEATAWFHAREEVSTLGPQRKGDLAGSQGDVRVRFFDFPLEEGKAWRLDWDGRGFHAEVEHVADGVATLRYRDDAGTERQIVYDAAARWFREMVFFEDGAQAYALRLVAHGSLHAGPAVRWQATLLSEASGQGAPAAPRTVEVPAGTTDLWGRFALDCGEAGLYALLLVPPGAGPGFDDTGTCGSLRHEGVLVEDPVPGGWTFAFAWLPADAAHAHALWARERVEVGPSA